MSCSLGKILYDRLIKSMLCQYFSQKEYMNRGKEHKGQMSCSLGIPARCYMIGIIPTYFISPLTFLIYCSSLPTEIRDEPRP